MNSEISFRTDCVGSSDGLAEPFTGCCFQLVLELAGTISGQIVMEGFLNFRMLPWARRMVTRLIAIIPAVSVAAAVGPRGVGQLLVLSQVILSLALPFAVIPLVHFTSTPSKMKSFVNPMWVRVLGGIIALIIVGLNAYLVVSSIKDGEFATAGPA